MDARNLLIDALDKQKAAYRENLKRCRAEFSRKAVHDLRTSIRRLLATLDVMAFTTSAARIEKLSDSLKEQLDEFSDLRDIQVMLDRVSEDIGTFPELEPFQNYLEKLEKREQRSDEKYVQNTKPGGVDKKLVKIQGALEDLSVDELQSKLPQAVDEAYLTVIQCYGEIDPAQLISIHHLRVAFKKFRYMVEVVHPCLPDFPEIQLQHMHDYQTQMGIIHDGQVILETLAAFAQDSNSYDPRPARRFYEKALAEALSTYLKNKGEVLNFWRSTPLVAFPWQREQKKKEV
ncbi:MAG TPA: CHAD domain-containing protein [Anaerolineales bacterium]|nr:CHAD domain-containing protein [Anaerolineales bacterium]